MQATIPQYDVDLYADAALLDPYPHYAALREAGAAVWLPRLQMWALSRYDDVRAAVQDHRTYSSAAGVSVDPEAGRGMAGTLLASDPPSHDVQRRVLAERLSPRALRAVEGEIQAWADEHVDAVLASGEFDAVTDLAKPFPVRVIYELVGLPQEDPLRMIEWADASFNLMGPDNDRSREAFGKLLGPGGLHEWLSGVVAQRQLRPGGFAATIWEAVDRGEITAEQAMWLLLGYATAGIDTTINAISSAIWLFARHPEQWDAVRDDPSLIPSAFNEVLRIESPIQGWARTATADHERGDVTIAAGDRVLLLFGSANRDPAKWPDPERFDVRRNPLEHVAFGRGIHVCAGNGLAKLEAHSVLRALGRRVRRFEIGEPIRHLNNTVRGLAHLPTTVVGR